MVERHLVTVIQGFDVTAIDYAHRPSTGQIALYLTGSSEIVATPAMRAANPKAVLIDQSPVITGIDTTADAYDMETGALTTAELGEVIKDAWNNYYNAVRPGQREPMVYMSLSQVTPVVNALTAASVAAHLWVAHYGVSLADAIAQVEAASGPYPIHAFQYSDTPGFYDLDVFDEGWLSTVSTTPVVTPPKPKPWHGVFTGTADGTVTREGNLFVMPLVSNDGGKTFTPTGPGHAL
jgi:hypothetical protein